MSDSPILDAVQEYVRARPVRFHMPGHKGRAFSLFPGEFCALDVTELPATGNLYEGRDPIAASERLAARHFNAPGCFYLTGGSTQGIYAALYLAAGRNAKIIADRNSHRALINACSLLSITNRYIYAKYNLKYNIFGDFDADDIQRAAEENPDARAIFVTSPTYYGVRHDIEKISAAAHLAGMKLIVDSAHGAHFPAVSLPCAVAEGADFCVLSAHKTLPALGQGAFLLTAAATPPEDARRATALFGTSSPSYPIMLSLESSTRPSAAETEKWKEIVRCAENLRVGVNQKTPFCALSSKDMAIDPLRVTVNTGLAGLTGRRASEFLMSKGMVPEAADLWNVIFILTSADEPGEIDRLLDAIVEMAALADIRSPVPPRFVPRAKTVLPAHRAVFAKRRYIPLCDAAGHIAAEPVFLYPPGVPVLCPGERADENIIEYLAVSGYNILREVAVCADSQAVFDRGNEI